MFHHFTWIIVHFSLFSSNNETLLIFKFFLSQLSVNQWEYVNQILRTIPLGSSSNPNVLRELSITPLLYRWIIIQANYIWLEIKSQILHLFFYSVYYWLLFNPFSLFLKLGQKVLNLWIFHRLSGGQRGTFFNHWGLRVDWYSWLGYNWLFPFIHNFVLFEFGLHSFILQIMF